MELPGRYYRYKPETTTVAISRDIHEALKAFALGRNFSMREAVEYLIRKALIDVYGLNQRAGNNPSG